MIATTYENAEKKEFLLRTMFSILDAKIQYADFQLNAFLDSILKKDQTPNRAATKEKSSIQDPDNVFTTIENSSLYTTKLRYLRGNINEKNSKKILYLITYSNLEMMSIEEIKGKI